MSTLSRKPAFAIGDAVRARDTGIVGHVFEINEISKTVCVNWTEGPTHAMVKRVFSITGHPDTWMLFKVPPAPAK